MKTEVLDLIVAFCELRKKQHEKEEENTDYECVGIYSSAMNDVIEHIELLKKALNSEMIK